MPPGQLLAQREFGFFRRPGPDISPQIGNSVYMGIHADAVIAETHSEHQVRRFPPDPGQFQQRIQAARNFPLMILNQAPAGLDQVPGFRPVESYGKYQAFDLGDGQCGGSSAPIRCA